MIGITWRMRGGREDPSTKTAEIEGNCTMPTALITRARAARPAPAPSPTRTSSPWPCTGAWRSTTSTARSSGCTTRSCSSGVSSARPSAWRSAGWSADRTSSAASPRSATKRRARPRCRAFRALKAYERDVLGRVVSPDESKAYDLLLDWLKKQEAIARMDVDDRGFTLKQTRSLYQRNAVSRQELDDAELAYNSALASVALNQSRQTRVRMELAAPKGEKPYDPVEFERLKAEHLKARVRYFEIVAEGARRRLTIAPGTLPARPHPHPRGRDLPESRRRCRGHPRRRTKEARESRRLLTR